MYFFAYPGMHEQTGVCIKFFIHTQLPMQMPFIAVNAILNTCFNCRIVWWKNQMETFNIRISFIILGYFIGKTDKLRSRLFPMPLVALLFIFFSYLRPPSSLPGAVTFPSINSVYIFTLICYNNVQSNFEGPRRGGRKPVFFACGKISRLTLI